MKRIYFFGDSNTFGFDPDGFFGGRYDRRRIWTYIVSERNGIEVLNRGENGREIPHSDFAFDLLDMDIRKYGPFDEFFVMLGLNDLFCMQGPTAELIAGRMKAFLQWLKKHPCMEGVGITVVAPPGFRLVGYSGEIRDYYESIPAALAREYRKVAEEEGTGFIDASCWDIDLADDGIHFSEKGHREFAEKISDSI